MASQLIHRWLWVVHNIKNSQHKKPQNPTPPMSSTTQSNQPLDGLYLHLWCPDPLTKPQLQELLEKPIILRGEWCSLEKPTTKKALFRGFTRCTSLLDGAYNIPWLSILVSWVDVIGKNLAPKPFVTLLLLSKTELERITFSFVLSLRCRWSTTTKNSTPIFPRLHTIPMV